MSSSSAPYFIDPELSNSSASDAQIYALAGGALQAHQEQHQLAGLVQAATAAADHDEHGRNVQDAGAASHLSQRAARKRRRELNDDGHDDSAGGDAQGDQDDGSLDHNRGSDGSATGSAGRGQHGQQHQAPGISSASALFRRPSKAAKKYTRPPMSKLFSSLELSPENFLQLQSAAKNYMLDPAHPDRQDTVGQRGKGDSELVRLRLWNCVKDFLENQGVGDRYFGPDVPGDEGQQRTMIWPRDKNSIIGAITPLLRRMVTNERQRQYAVETRRSGASTGNQAEGGESSSAKLASDLVSPALGSRTQESQLPVASRSLFELTTGAKPSEYIVGEVYDWPVIQPHLVMLISQIGLPEQDVKQIVASISYHLRYTHREGFSLHRTNCYGSCPGDFIERMVNTGRLDSGSFEQTEAVSLPEKRRRMKPLLRQVFDIVQNIISNTAASEPRQPLDSSLIDRALVPSAKEDGGVEERGDADSLMLHVNLLQNGNRIAPRRDIQADKTPYLHSLVQDAVSWVGPVSLGSATVRVLSPEGLLVVADDASWQRVIRLASGTVWMENEMKVLVDFA